MCWAESETGQRLGFSPWAKATGWRGRPEGGALGLEADGPRGVHKLAWIDAAVNAIDAGEAGRGPLLDREQKQNSGVRDLQHGGEGRRAWNRARRRDRSDRW